MVESPAITLVKRAYAALEAEDIPGFLELCAPDIVWDYPAVKELAFGGIWRGHEGVARFFEAHDEAEEIRELTTHELIAEGERVVVFGFYRGRARSSGREWETRFVHTQIVRNGKIQRFEGYFDTAAAVKARQG